MKLLVIGASGFIGRHLMAEARKRDDVVVGTQSRARHADLLTVDLTCERISTKLPPGFSTPGEPAFGVICVKLGPLDHGAQDRALSRRVELDCVLEAAEDLLRAGIRPVVLSSSYVFDGTVGYYPEEYPHSPINDYGVHKSEVEKRLQPFLGEVLILRLDKIVGDASTTGHLFSEWYGLATARKPIVCIADQILSPTFAGDVARAVLVGCEQGLTGIYNAANCEFFERGELARQFTHALGLETTVVSKPQEQFGFSDRRPLKSYLDGSRFARATKMRFTTVRELFATYTGAALQQEATEKSGS